MYNVTFTRISAVAEAIAAVALRSIFKYSNFVLENLPLK